MKITAVIALHNGEEFINSALDSVFSQTRPADEVIVVNDGSSDASPQMVASHREASKIRLITKTNGGQSSARNLGIKYSSGSHIALLDQDDIWYPNHLEVLAKPYCFPCYPKVGVSYSTFDNIDRSGNLISLDCIGKFGSRHPKTSVQEIISSDLHLWPSASLFSVEAFEAAGGFDEQFIGYEDDDLFLRMFLSGFRHEFVGISTARVRNHSGSASYSERMDFSRERYAAKILANFRGLDPLIADPVYRAVYARFHGLALSELKLAIKQSNRRKMDHAIRMLELLSDLSVDKKRALFHLGVAKRIHPGVGLTRKILLFNFRQLRRLFV